MQNEFEKQVQGKMDQLKMDPSASVWQKVQAGIKDDKKKRRLIFFLLPLLLLGGIAIWQLNIAGDNSSNTPGITSQNNQGGQSTVPSIKLDITPPAVAEKTDTALLEEETPQSPIHRVTELLTTSRIAAKSAMTNEPIAALEETPPAAAEEKKPDNEAAIAAMNDKKTDSTAMAGVITGKDSSSIVTEPVPAAVDTSTRVVIDNVPVDNELNKKNKNKASTSKWMKVVSLQAGSSKYNTGLFTTAAFDQYSASPGNSNGSPVPVVAPSAAKAGPSFSIGAGLAKSLTERLELSAMLQYHYYSVITKTGSAISTDTTAYYQGSVTNVRTYYQNVNGSDYKNNFHMLELPVNLRYTFSDRVPLALSAGAAFGRLLKTNALTYDNVRNFYYYNEQNNNRNYFSFSSSLQYMFGGKGKTRFGVGPAIQYSPSQIQKQSRYNAPHLFHYGIKADIKF